VTAVSLGVSNFKRDAGFSAKIILRNMFVEKDPTNLVDGYVRLQRPGLAHFADVGSGPTRCVFKQLGTFGGDFLVVSGPNLYRVTEAGVVTPLGFITGAGRCQIAAGGARALIATGTDCYSTDGVTVTQIAMPDAQPVQSVAYINGYFVLTIAGGQRLYWIAPGETNPDALSFASAENSPDDIARVERIGDELWFFGQGNSTEVWVPTGNADLAFQRVEGRLYNQGAANRDTIVRLDNTLFWVGTDKVVYRGDSVPVRISDNSVEEMLSQAGVSELRAWAFAYQGHTFYCLTIGSKGTRVFDVSTGTWPEFTSYGRPAWRAHIGAQTDGSLIVAGDDEQGKLWRLEAGRSNDDGKPLIRELTGGAAVMGRPVPCASFSLLAATGRANASGPGSDPVVELRWSDNGGNAWSDWAQISLGKRGEYGREVAVTRLGMMRAPGRLFHLRMSEDTVFRLNYAKVNDWMAG